MGTKFTILLGLVYLLGCSKREEPKLQVAKEYLPEQVAIDFLFNELINRDSLFYIEDEKEGLINVQPQTLTEDSLFTNGLFFWKKIYATKKINTLSKVSHSSYELEMFGATPDEVQRVKEFEEDFIEKDKLNISSIKIELPPTISVLDSDSLKKEYLDNSLFIEAKHDLESADQYMVEISVYNLEYDEYKNIRIFLDKKYNVLDWNM